MPQTVTERLERLRNRATLYELAISRGDTAYLVAYCRKGQRGIWDAITSKHRVHHVVALAGTQTLHFAKRASDGGTIGEWSVRFTGRTERDAIIGGELTYVGNLNLNLATEPTK